MEYSRYNYHGTTLYRRPVPLLRPRPGDRRAQGAIPPPDVQILGINDFHGRITRSRGRSRRRSLAGAVKQLRDEYPKTVFAAAGDLIGASTFESFIQKDKPTIDALNAAGLEVSAVGNHEFDQGYGDLVDRVMAPYDPMTTRGGAEWEYLGANVRKATGAGAARNLDPGLRRRRGRFRRRGDRRLAELVSPAGIADIEVPP